MGVAGSDSRALHRPWCHSHTLGDHAWTADQHHTAQNGTPAAPQASLQATVPTCHAMNGSTPIHSSRNRAAVNMQAAPRDKLVARFFSLYPSFFSIRNSDHIYFAFPKSLSGQLEFEAVFTSKLSQAALTYKKKDKIISFFFISTVFKSLL